MLFGELMEYEITIHYQVRIDFSALSHLYLRIVRDIDLAKHAYCKSI